jgi:hypothetical protein
VLKTRVLVEHRVVELRAPAAASEDVGRIANDGVLEAFTEWRSNPDVPSIAWGGWSR